VCLITHLIIALPLVLVAWYHFMDPDQQHYKIFTWNIRGVNNTTCQEDVKQVISIYKPDLVCLQETKMESVSQAIIRNGLGPAYQDSFAYLPTIGASGGIVIAANTSFMCIYIPSLSNLTRFGTMGTTSLGLGKQEQGSLP
jgi:hypothetical protein